MDFNQETLDNRKAFSLKKGSISAFGISQQGDSHLEKDPPVPCQDCFDMRFLEDQGLLIAAIADGVGSCFLSHWGAHTAVHTAIDSACNALAQMAPRTKLKLKSDDREFCSRMKTVMVDAFQNAQDAVEALAATGEPEVPVFAFQSTLTLAIYDGDCLFHGHVGDDGIVAQLPDGTVEMATRRVKGEEANSVFPLQSGKDVWLFGVVPHVAGFIMATDGVLDSFVASSTAVYSYFGGIYYNFMERAIYGLAENSGSTPERIMREYHDFLLSKEYRSKVCDDLTFLAIVNSKTLCSSSHPSFSVEAWTKAAQEGMVKRQKKLYSYMDSQETEEPGANSPSEKTIDPKQQAPSPKKIYEGNQRQSRKKDSGPFVPLNLQLPPLEDDGFSRNSQISTEKNTVSGSNSAEAKMASKSKSSKAHPKTGIKTNQNHTFEETSSMAPSAAQKKHKKKGFLILKQFLIALLILAAFGLGIILGRTFPADSAQAPEMPPETPMIPQQVPVSQESSQIITENEALLEQIADLQAQIADLSDDLSEKDLEIQKIKGILNSDENAQTNPPDAENTQPSSPLNIPEPIPEESQSDSVY